MLGGGAHQGQSGWSKTTGAMDLLTEAQGADIEVPDRGSTEAYGAFTEVGGGFIMEASQRLWGAAAEVFNREEEVGGEAASRTRVWRSFWSFHRSDFTAVGLHLKGQDTGKDHRKDFQKGGLCALRWYNSTREERRASRGYQEERKWCGPLRNKGGFCFCFLNPGRMSGSGGTEAGPARPSRSEATIRKVVKIPKEEESMFDGKGFHQLLDLFEMAVENKEAEDYDKVKQAILFCKGSDLKEEVMEMEGWRELDWGKLVKEKKARWGRYRLAPRYTIQELWTAVDGWEKKGGVSSKGDYEEFSYFFDTRLKYQEKEGTFRNEDEACPLLWRALSKELQEMAKVRLIKGKKMVENRSGGYSLPTLKELKLAVDAEMKFKGEVSVEGSVYYRPFQGENKIMREELNKNRGRGVKEPEAVDHLAKKLDQMTEILRSFIGQTVERSARLEESLKKAGERREVFEARGSGRFVCYYCGMQGHASTRCPIVEETKAEGRPAYYLPDNTTVHYDRTGTFRSVVAAHFSKVPLEKFTTQVAELVGPRVQEAGIIHLPEPLPAKEESFVGCISLVHPKEEEEDERKIMEVDLGKKVRVQKEGAEEPGLSRKREKATAVPGEEEVLQRIADKIGEEEEDYEQIQQEKGEGKEEAVVTMKLTPREQERILKARKRAATLLKEGPRHLESQLGREYPGAISKTLKTILNTEVKLRLGDLPLTSSGVADGLKRQMTRMRVPSGVDWWTWEADSDVEDPRFCTPLGFLKATVGKHRTKGLVDSGSIINVIPEELARKWGLAMVGSEMKLRGVVGHLTSLVGVVEVCPVGLKGKMESNEVPFCVALGVKHLILGRPFLMDLEARLEYGETGEVMSYVMGDGEWLKLPLHVPEDHPKPKMDKGWLYQYNEFLTNGWAEKEKEERIKTLKKIKRYKKLNKIIKEDKKVEGYDGVNRQRKREGKDLGLLGKSINCSWVGRFGKKKAGKGRGVERRFFDEGVAEEENGLRHWKEGQKLGGGATDLSREVYQGSAEERVAGEGSFKEKTLREVVCVHIEGTTPPEKEGGYLLDTKEDKSGNKGGFCFCFLNLGRMSGSGGTEAGPAGPSRSEATIRKVVKIPKEEESMFDGKGFHQFLDLFEMAVENKEAEDYDKVKQAILFCKGSDLKEEVMEMEGWRELDWGKLVKEKKARWGRYRLAPRYTIQELWTAVDGWEKKGGVSSKGDYEELSYFFDTRLKYLEKEGTFRNEDEACPLLWRALSKELQEMAKVRLIKGKTMVENRSGGYSLPTLKELKLAVDAEMKFKGEVSVEGSVYYRPFQGENKIMREELNKNRGRGVKEPEAVDHLAKKLDQMTEILRSFIGQTVERSARLEESLKKAGERREVFEARGSGRFVCYYCGMQGHASTRCPIVEETKAEGRPAYYLPDNTTVHYDRTGTFRSVVAAHFSKVPLEKFTTQVAELVGPRVQEAGIIHLPEPLPAKEESFVGCISLVHPKEEEEDERKIMEVDLGKKVRVQKEGAEEPGLSRKREKATAVPGEEEVLQRIADKIGEEEEDYEQIQQEKGEGKEEAVVTMKLTPREQERILKARKRAATLLKEGPRHLESQLGREYPGAISKTLKTILNTEVKLRLGDLPLTSSGVADGLKRQMTRMRVPSGVDWWTWEADSDVEDPRFCTPLGFLKATVGKHRTKGLVDSGSIINVIPEELARKWGLAMVGSEMKLRGVVGHLTSLVGVVEVCPVGLKGKMESNEVPFCVALGVKHLILGRPFLMDLEARLEYGETGEVMSYVMGDGEWLKLPLHVPEDHPKPKMDKGWLYQYIEFLTNGCAEKEKEERIKTVEKIKEYKKVNKIIKEDKKIEVEELGLLGKSRNCSWVGLVDYYSTPVSHFNNREEEDKSSPVIKGRREDKKKWSEWEFPALKKVEEDRRLLDKSVNCTTYGEEALKRVVEWVYGTQDKQGEEGFQSRGWERKQEKSKPWRTWEFRKEEKEKELEFLDKSRNCSWVGEVAHNPCWKELGKEDPGMDKVFTSTGGISCTGCDYHDPPKCLSPLMS
ncbi:hypothetical protein PPACK8108_LOCUS7300 [Phakopsora pachyrhizi]|uniref:CCHC-type domain-containing protein n=1 Tax=Phakopsora pachyrhizi TaxID=170000 RepID=A0AAV0ASJ2_PHAPC|nr:hypothetical protein PPACK8108_LOCUS7300 [Phakopsora pachyrhizi]